MSEFKVKEIQNGWVFQGPSDRGASEVDELFLPNVQAVADTLVIWYLQGSVKAIGMAEKKYGKPYVDIGCKRS